MDGNGSAGRPASNIAVPVLAGGGLWLALRIGIRQPTADVLGVAGAAALLFWSAARQVRAGVSLGRAFAYLVLALAPLLFLASTTQSHWLYQGASTGGLHGGGLYGVTLGALAAAVASYFLVRLVAVEDAAALSSCVAGPILLVPVALESVATHGVSWRLLGPVGLLVGLLVGGGLVTLKYTRGLRPALALGGCALLILLPALAIGVHEWVNGFEDWPCSSLNFHLGLQPWMRVFLMGTTIGLLVQAGVLWVRGRRRVLAVALSALAVLLQVPASYKVTRSGCDGRNIESANVLLAGQVLDPGCPREACYCGVSYDRLDRPVLLRRSAGPARLHVPAWLIEGDRSALEFLLARQDAPLLPPGQCVR